MTRGLWAVLGLAGAIPVVALAQPAREPPEEQVQVPQDVSNEMLQQQINELWQGFRMLQEEVATLRESVPGRQEAPAVAGQPGEPSPAEEEAEEDTLPIVVELPALPERGQEPGAGVGGSGPGARGQGQEDVLPRADIYLGTVRAVTEDRLFMREQTGRVYELRVSEGTRVIGWDGTPTILEALEEGTPVRAVATKGVEGDQVHTLYILMPAPVPER